MLAKAGGDRGKIFVGASGSGATFVSSADIWDKQSTQTIQPHGKVHLADGRKYSIFYGQVTKITDRNGNYLTFEYTSGPMTKVTDSLSRETTISYWTHPYDNYSLHGIDFKGADGAPRNIQVNVGPLDTRLLSGVIDSYQNSFPTLNVTITGDHNPMVAHSVTLPDGREYSFNPDSHFSFDSANHRVASDAFIYAGWKALKALRRSTPNG